MDRPLLLRTKFLVPRLRSDYVERPRLLCRLEAAFQSRLAVVSAPAGYGKTTLLASLAHQTDVPVIWYQLDAADNDPLVFLHYLIEGLRCSLAGCGNTALTLLDTRDVQVQRALMVLLNEVTASVANDFLIVMEDYHWISHNEIHDLVDFLLEHLPPQMHVLISTRTEPPLSLARLRASGNLVELRARDLRFTADEIAQLTAHLGLDETQLHLLEQRTEGWGAGLQLILTALSPTAAPAEQLARRLESPNRYVFEYLAQEVFEQQPPEVQAFLLRSAVLNQMSAETVNALLGTTDAERFLAHLERQGLFIMRLDEEYQWYRYHQLFRDFLLNRLMREAPEEALKLHATAGDRYAERQLWDQAAAHYVAAHHPEGLARAVHALAPTYLQTGRVETLYRYIEALPAAMVRDTPDFLLYQGHALRYWGRVDEAVAAYEAARSGYAARGEQGRLSHTLTQLAGVSRSRGHYREAQELAQLAVDAAGETDHAERAQALMALAKNTGLLENMAQGYYLGEQGLQEARLAGAALAPDDRARLLWSQAQLAWWYGDPSATIAHCQSALAADQNEISPQMCRAYVMMTSPYLYWHNLPLARQFGEKGVSLAERLQFTEWLPMARAALGNVVTRQDPVAGERHLRDAIALSRQLGVQSYARLMATSYLAFDLAQQGRLAEARQILETALHLHDHSPETYELLVCRSVLGDVLLDIGDLDMAWDYFLNLRRACEARQFRLPLAMIYFALGYLHLEGGRRESALDLIQRSLDIIGPANAIQLYLDQGQRAVTICREARAAGIRTPLVERVLKLLPASQRRAVTPRGVSATPGSRDEGDAAADGIIEVVTLGDFRLFRAGQELGREAGLTGKVRELLAYFITRRERRLALDRVVEDLWPQVDPERGQAVFHTTLYRLRRALRRAAGEGDYVHHESREYELQVGRFRIDADMFDEHLSHARQAVGAAAIEACEAAVNLYAGPYLVNLYPEWCAGERRRLELAYITTLSTLATHYASAGGYHRAIALYQQILEIDPLQEQIHCDLMRLWDRVGNRSAVVKQYQTLGQLLDEELSAEPMPETQAVYAAIVGDNPCKASTFRVG